MKTAMQELWDVLNDAEQNGVYEIGTQNFKRYIEEIYLKKEKEQIMDAQKSGRNFKNEDGAQYYRETFSDNPEAGI